MSVILEMLSYPFLVRALVVGVLVSLCASLLGTSLVLKRYSMIGDGLSHVGFAALAIAYPLGFSPLYISIPICVITAFFLLQLKDSAKIKGDAATALMCSGALAVGVMVISLTTGMNTDVCNYMFGSILAMSRSDLYISVVLSIAVLILYVMFFHRLFAVTFDEAFAEATGTNVRLYNMVIAILTAVTVVLGMRMMGTLLISSLIVFPALTAMRVTKKFKTTVILSAGIALFCFFAGLIFSYLHSVPTGACIVVTNIIAFILFWSVEKWKEERTVQ
jgi:ABC-type Mn2+/Zn2+ transport system permease subunit